MNMSVSLTRNTHFHDSGTCSLRSTMINMSINFRMFFLNRFFIEFWWILTSFLEVFLLKMAIKIEKGEFMKMNVSSRRNAHFHRFGTWFWKPKSINKSIKKRNGFWKAFLMNFAQFWSSFWINFAPKTPSKNWSNLVKNSKTSLSDPTPQIYTTGADYKSGGTPGEGSGRGTIINRRFCWLVY